MERRRGRAGDLHHAEVPARRLVRVHDLTTPALVLGSAQPASTIVAEHVPAGWDLVRRRSGGGVVHLVPGAQVWVDVVVPAGDPLWDDDVCRASWWLGEAWVRSLGHGRVHRAGVGDRALARVACFASVGPGEVVRDRAGPDPGRPPVKLVGISQRRTRHAARFQCVAYRVWDPAPLVASLAPGSSGEPLTRDRAAVERAAERLRLDAAAALPGWWDPVEHLVPHLPA